MTAAKPFIEMNIHPTVIVAAYYKALEVAKSVISECARTIDTNKDDEVFLALQSCIGTKFASRWGNLIADLSLKATRIIFRGGNKGKLNLEIKRYAKIEKIPGGTLDQSEVMNGVMIKTHASYC
jgi:T-complex protein 1 subunit gamma